MTPESRRRRRWATATIRSARDLGPLPHYGTAEWWALDQADPRWLAAIVVSAEAWAIEADDLADRLAVEIEAARAAEDRLVAEQIRRMAARPTVDELARRRAS